MKNCREWMTCLMTYNTPSGDAVFNETFSLRETEARKEQILCRVKENRFLFAIKNIWNTFWYAAGIILSIGLGTLLIAGVTGSFSGNGKMNPLILNIGLTLIPLLIAIRIIYIIFLRKNQFYTVSDRSVTSEGGFLTRFEQKLRMNEIQSVSYTQTLIQQALGCGNIVISSAATCRSRIVLTDIDNVKKVYRIISQFQWGGKV